MSKMSAADIESGLAAFSGTERYHSLSMLHGRLLCTDGVAWLAKNAEAYWLIDIIASYQARCAKDDDLRHMQFWTIRTKDGKGLVTCDRDEGDTVIAQEVPHTDFPLAEARIWVEAGMAGDKPAMIAMLPGER